MEVCKERLPVEEYVIEIHVLEATTFHVCLRFALLARKWLPRPVGVCVWSLLRILLAVLYTLALPASFIVVFLAVVYMDAIVLFTLGVYLPLGILLINLGVVVIAAAARVWHLITCFHFHAMSGRGPGQGLVHYILFGGEPLAPGAPQSPFLLMGGGRGPWGLWLLDSRIFFTWELVRHVTVVSMPYWRLQFRNLWEETLPLYDAVVI